MLENPIDHQANKARLLSAVGALVTGIGAAMLLPRTAQAIGALVLLAGIMAHTVGMFGARRSERAAGYQPAPWETAAYWLCSVLIAAVLAAVGSVLLCCEKTA
jgi:hypothetical protein